jgi:hypothetical protein
MAANLANAELIAYADCRIVGNATGMRYHQE